MEEEKSTGHAVVLSRLSSVVPATPSTGSQIAHLLTDSDLSMKLQYVRAVYYFEKRSVENFCDGKWKEAFLDPLLDYRPVAERLNLAPDGRLYVKCNDAGVRIFEAFSDSNLKDWEDLKDCCLEPELSRTDQNLGSDFSSVTPLVIVQFTRFKCGGVAIGVSWSHVLGDAFSASVFMKEWGESYRRNRSKPCPATCTEHRAEKSRWAPNNQFHKDLWVNTQQENTMMETASFRLSETMVYYLMSQAQDSKSLKPVTPFVAISAFVWKSILKAHPERRYHNALICTNVSKYKKASSRLGNINQILTQVQISNENGSIELSNLDLCKIAQLIQNGGQRTSMNGDGAALVYGSDLTFLNLEHLPCYDLVLEQEGPVHVSYTVEPVGDNGMVIIIPSSEGGKSRVVKVSLYKDELVTLKEEFIQFSIV
uniref:CHAT5 n=1 Tax=Pinus tabuliformis TaxID=88731 RepID=A0A0K0M6U4_PINTB|nr:CHAT5 [Pinus tabuliformis]